MPLRIALVTPRFRPYIGGVETHVARLAVELTARGHAVEVFTQRTERESPSYEQVEGVDIRRYDGPGARSAYPVPTGLRKALVERGRAFDVVHVHAYHALAALTGLGVRRSDAPLVFTPHYHATGHTTPARAAHIIYRPVGRELFRRASRVICVSASEADLVRRDFGSRVTSRIVVIPNGVDVDALLQAEPYELDYPVVLSAGRLVEYKNVDLLVKAAQALPAGVRVVVVGEGPHRKRLERLAAQSGGRDRVMFLGGVGEEELRRWYRSAAVSVQMSRHEAFGIGVLEALAAGTQVVASSLPAHRHVAELVGASQVKFLDVGAGPEELATSIREALREGCPVATVLRSVPTWSAVAEQTEGVYAEALRHSQDRRDAR